MVVFNTLHFISNCFYLRVFNLLKINRVFKLSMPIDNMKTVHHFCYAIV